MSDKFTLINEDTHFKVMKEGFDQALIIEKDPEQRIYTREKNF